MEPKHLFHKMGGRIAKIRGVGHRTLEKVPYWFYLCDVVWDDGKTSEGIEVMPDRLCCDGTNADAMAEINKVNEALMKHLRTQGTWLKKAEWIGDRLVHWTAKQPAHVQPI